VRITVYNCRTKQHRTVLIIFPLILQTIIIAQMMSTGGERSTVDADSGCKTDVSGSWRIGVYR